MRHIEKIFKALADRNRIRILKMLETRHLCVCEMTGVMGIAQPSVSRHLAILRDAGLVIDTREGQWTIYSLAGNTDDRIGTLLLALRRWGNDDPLILADRGKVSKITRESICAKAVS